MANKEPGFIRIPRPGRGKKGTFKGAPAAVAPVPEGQTSSQRDGNGERIVIPRQDRGTVPRSGLDVELREVRYGASSRGPYLRVVPKRRSFTHVAHGHIEATRLASEPEHGIGRVVGRVKGSVLGRPLETSRAIHERLTNWKALAVLGSDPLSSSAYATEETLIILAGAGAGALIYSLPIAAVVASLMVIVVVSYRQTQKAYPSGGGAYIVAHENLGPLPGLVAAGALLVDYVLLVSVSVAAGVAAITSAVPELFDLRVPISVVVIALFTLGNLRGIRESGSIFAAPTYFFVVAMGAVVAIGLVKVVAGEAPGSLMHAAPPREQVIAVQGLSLWLVLRAFSSGGAALTGVEAMSNNIPNFKPPESENARKTLTVMAIIAIYLFLGISFLSSRYGLVPSGNETIVSQLGREVLGTNPLYFVYQATTAMVLFLAANTSFYDFPLLSAILARDSYMPRQFMFKGDRLAYSHGIIALALVATVLLIVFQADTTKLIPLYAVGVFVSFTLSQSGMVKHWLNLKETGWRASLVMNGVGAVATGVVAVIITMTKFTHGAWISMVMMIVLVIVFALINRHYAWYRERIKAPAEELPSAFPRAQPLLSGEPRQHVVVPVDDINKITLGALAMAREISCEITAVHVTDDREAAERFRERWSKDVPDVPLLVIESPYRALVAPMAAYLKRLQVTAPSRRVDLILPVVATWHWWERFLHNRDIQRLRGALAGEDSIRVINFVYDPKARAGA